jgi:CBS domain-containing protein
MEARDVMTTPVTCVEADTTVEEAARLLLERRISAVPVVDASGRLQGIVSEGDLIRHTKAAPGRSRSWWLSLFVDDVQVAEDYAKSHGLTASDVMTRTVVSATESTPLDKIATLLERHRIKRVPIVRRGKVVGIVSRANLLHGLVAQKGTVRRTVVKDRDIRARIMKELDQAGLDVRYLNVVVMNGAVELWGLVEAEAQKRALSIAARSTAGVKRVANNVTVASPELRNALRR